VDRLKCAEVGIGQIYVAPAIAPGRDGGRSHRARHRQRRSAGPSVRERQSAEQPHCKINQQANDQKLKQGADRRASRAAVRGVAAMAEQPGTDQAARQPGQEGMSLEKAAAPISRRGRGKTGLRRRLWKRRRAADQRLRIVVLVCTQPAAAHARRATAGGRSGPRFGDRGCQYDARAKKQCQDDAPFRQWYRRCSARPKPKE